MKSMNPIKAEDIMGFFIGQECVCTDCASKEERAGAVQGKIITRGTLENGDELHFCNRCDKPIASARIMKLLSAIRTEKNKY